MIQLLSKKTIVATTVVTSAFLTIESAKAADKHPNILFALVDDVSFPHMGAYGCKWVNTPIFDHIARNGILFQNAYTPNAKSAPSRSSLLTGRNSWQLEAAANHMCYSPPDYKVITEVLAENGYHVLNKNFVNKWNQSFVSKIIPVCLEWAVSLIINRLRHQFI